MVWHLSAISWNVSSSPLRNRLCPDYHVDPTHPCTVRSCFTLRSFLSNRALLEEIVTSLADILLCLGSLINWYICFFADYLTVFLNSLNLPLGLKVLVCPSPLASPEVLDLLPLQHHPLDRHYPKMYEKSITVSLLRVMHLFHATN